MNPEPTPSPREQWEIRLVAWLLGEASPAEAAEIERAVAQDPDLARFQRELQATLGLVREAARSAPAEGGSAPRLSADRRARVLARLRAPAPANVLPLSPTAAPRRRRSWTIPLSLAATLAVLGLIALLIMPRWGRPLMLAQSNFIDALDAAPARTDADADGKDLYYDFNPAVPVVPPPSLPGPAVVTTSGGVVAGSGVATLGDQPANAKELPALGLRFQISGQLAPPSGSSATAPAKPAATAPQTEEFFMADANGRVSGKSQFSPPAGGDQAGAAPLEGAADFRFDMSGPGGGGGGRGGQFSGGRAGNLPAASQAKGAKGIAGAYFGYADGGAAVTPPAEITGLGLDQKAKADRFGLVTDTSAAGRIDDTRGSAIATRDKLAVDAPINNPAPAEGRKASEHYNLPANDTLAVNGVTTSAWAGQEAKNTVKSELATRSEDFGGLKSSRSSAAEYQQQEVAQKLETVAGDKVAAGRWFFDDKLQHQAGEPASTERFSRRASRPASGPVAEAEKRNLDRSASRQKNLEEDFVLADSTSLFVQETPVARFVSPTPPATPAPVSLFGSASASSSFKADGVKYQAEAKPSSELDNIEALHKSLAPADPQAAAPLGNRSAAGVTVVNEVEALKELALAQTTDWDEQSEGWSSKRLPARAGLQASDREQVLRRELTLAEAAKSREQVELRERKTLEKLDAKKRRLSEETVVAGKPVAKQPAPPAPVATPADVSKLSTVDSAAPARPAAPPLLHQPEIAARENAVSTFSLNVSDVAFKLAGASLDNGALPDPNSVRVEEFVNAFQYRDPAPAPGARLAFHWERAHYPFAHNRDLLRFSVQTAALGREPQKPLNLVLLLDNSGSMERPDRVQTIQAALRALAAQLKPSDRISVVSFARTAQLCVDGLAGNQAEELVRRVGELNPQGGTNLEDALALAYQTARRHFQTTGNNRVILLTDGAANLGNVDPATLRQSVVQQRQKGIALDCFGIGWEGYNDDLLENLSRNGDGRYGFLNDPAQAGPEFASLLAGALQVAAKNVKAQVEFNPARVRSWRQVGYARHQLTREQFRDNTVDAAELAAAETGNALYLLELLPQGQGPLGVVRVRYQVPATGEFVEQEWSLADEPRVPLLDQAPPALRLAATSAAFGEWLSHNPYAGDVKVTDLPQYLAGVPETFAPDPRPQRLADMIRQAIALQGKP
jgi:Mg-chelatase subunit ChlD